MEDYLVAGTQHTYVFDLGWPFPSPQLSYKDSGGPQHCLEDKPPKVVILTVILCPVE